MFCSSLGILSAGTRCGYWPCYIRSLGYGVVCQFFKNCIYYLFLVVFEAMQSSCLPSCFYSLILAFFDGFCLQQLLLCLPNGGFSSVTVPLTCIINQNSTLRKSCPVSPTYVFIQLFIQLVLMDIYFILQVIIHYCYYFLLILSQIRPLGTPSHLFLCPFDSPLLFLKHFFTVWQHKMFQTYPFFDSPLESVISPVSFYQKMVFRN